MQTRLLLLQLFIMQVIIVYKLCTQQTYISMRINERGQSCQPQRLPLFQLSRYLPIVVFFVYN